MNTVKFSLLASLYFIVTSASDLPASNVATIGLRNDEFECIDEDGDPVWATEETCDKMKAK